MTLDVVTILALVACVLAVISIVQGSYLLGVAVLLLGIALIVT